MSRRFLRALGWIVKATVVLALPTGLWLGGFFRSEEKRGIRRMLGELAAFVRGRSAST